MSVARLSLPLAMVAFAAGLAAAAPGSSGATTATAASHPGDWTRFGYDAARTDAAPSGLSEAEVGALSEHRVELDGTVDSSPIYLAGVQVGGATRDLLIVATSYGRTLGLDPATGATLWRFTPKSYSSLAGSGQFTTATPVADPSRRFVYAASPDGRIHKLRVADGGEVRSRDWPASVTRDPSHEKISSALNLYGRYVFVTTAGYVGDLPPYQGKVVAIDRDTGRVAHVFNSLCSNRRRIIDPATCRQNHSGIWGRGGAVVDPSNRHVFVATGNAAFDGKTNWGDSDLELSAGAGHLLRHYTPANQARLRRLDADLASASPALLPPPGGAAPRYLLQGGKDAKLRLLRLSTSLSGIKGAAGRRLGGQIQTLPTPGGDPMVTAPAVLHTAGSTLVFAATDNGTAAYRLRGGDLRVVWKNATPGTSPVVAGGLLWVYDRGGALDVYRASSGALVRSLPAPPGHWNSPIVAGGRAFLPSGDANSRETSGVLSIYSPG